MFVPDNNHVIFLTEFFYTYVLYMSSFFLLLLLQYDYVTPPFLLRTGIKELILT